MNSDDPLFINPPFGGTASYDALYSFPYTASSSFPHMPSEYSVPISMAGNRMVYPVPVEGPSMHFSAYSNSEPAVPLCHPVPATSSLMPLAPQNPAPDVTSSLHSTYNAG